MSALYEKCDGTTIMSIKHHGDSFSYCNSETPFRKRYFAGWDPLLPFMRPGSCYLIGASVKKLKSGYKISPFGIAFEVDEQTAKSAAREHFRQVMNDGWDAKKQKAQLIADWLQYQEDYLYAVREEATINLLENT